MAFVSSFTHTTFPFPPTFSKSPRRARHTPRANASRNNSSNESSSDPIPPFLPFDGSVPLLPPWQPPTLESDFTYNAQRIISREAHETPKKLVQVHSRSMGTLFAQVVQEVMPAHTQEGARRKVWLRPLLLDGYADTFVDLRGGSDVFIEAERVEQVEEEVKVRVEINLAATEGDWMGRVVEDERWGESAAGALLRFMTSLVE